MKNGFNKLANKTCILCNKKGVSYKVWLPNWKQFIYACPACTRDWTDEEEFANDYELGNLVLVK